MFTRRTAMKLVAIVCCASTGLAQVAEYIPLGPPESALLEKWVSHGWVRGITPRAEILERGIPKEGLPDAFVSKIETWIGRVLRPELTPRKSEDVAMLGLPKLRLGVDFIVGHFPCQSCDAPDRAKSIEFQATERSIGLTLHSASVKVARSGGPSAGEIIATVSRFLNIPKNKVGRMTLRDYRFADVGGMPVCDGRLQCEWDDNAADEEQRRWWSEIGFWMTEGRLYVDISMFDAALGDRRRASKKHLWPLTTVEKSAADLNPDVAKRPKFLEFTSGPWVYAGPEFRLDPRDFRILARDKITQESIELMRTRYERVLGSPLLPESAKDDVQWQCFDVYGEYAPLLNPMTGKWVRDGVAVSVFGAPQSETLEVTLKFTGDRRMGIRVLTKGEGKAASAGGASLPDGVDKEVMRRTLTECFRFPFANLDDFQLFGGGTVSEDVPLFTGTLKSRYRVTEFVAKEQADYAKLKWYDVADLFITDSDPQYFCITIGRLGPSESTPQETAPG